MDKSKYTPPFRVGKKQNRAVLDSNGLEVVIFPEGNERFAQSFCNHLNKQKSNENEDVKVYFWKLHCKNINNNYRAQVQTFKGTTQEVTLYVNKINYGNYNYFVVDFEKL